MGKSIELNDAAIAKSKTIVWNGPMGVFEMGAFEAGTKKMMEKIVEVTAAGAISVIGGGDTATACKNITQLTKCRIAALGVEHHLSCLRESYCLVLQLSMMPMRLVMHLVMHLVIHLVMHLVLQIY